MWCLEQVQRFSCDQIHPHDTDQLTQGLYSHCDSQPVYIVDKLKMLCSLEQQLLSDGNAQS